MEWHGAQLLCGVQNNGVVRTVVFAVCKIMWTCKLASRGHYQAKASQVACSILYSPSSVDSFQRNALTRTDSKLVQNSCI